MAIKWLSTAWKNDLKERAQQTERIYIDFRQEIYPPYNGVWLRGNQVEGILIGDIVEADTV